MLGDGIGSNIRKSKLIAKCNFIELLNMDNIKRIIYIYIYIYIYDIERKHIL